MGVKIKYNFDKIINRRYTNSLKYDFALMNLQVLYNYFINFVLYIHKPALQGIYIHCR